MDYSSINCQDYSSNLDQSHIQAKDNQPMTTKPPSEIFAENLHTILKKTGMRPAELARRSGISSRMIGFILSGERKPTIDTAETLSQALGLECWQMLIPNIVNEINHAKELTALVDNFLCSGKNGRDYILHVAEKEAEYKK